MNAWIFQAALYCDACADTLPRAPDPDDESSYDSNDFRKGPYPHGGGESDTPTHCDACGVFLRNPLTPDGVAYVQDAVNAGRGACVAEWSDFYDIHPATPDPAPGV